MSNQRAICDLSGFEYPMDDLVKQWDGAMVHKSFVDKRNPQDFVRAVKEHIPRVTRPEAADTFLTTNQVQPSDL